MAQEPKKPKKWWLVNGQVTVGAYTYVQADSEEEAKQIATGRDPVLCPYGPERDGENPIESAIVDDADGAFVPTRAEAEEPDAEYLDDLAGEE